MAHIARAVFPFRGTPTNYVLIATPKSSFLDSATFCVSNRGLVEISQLSEFQWNSLCMMPWLCRGSCPLWAKADILGALPPESIPVKANALFGQYGIACLRAV